MRRGLKFIAVVLLAVFTCCAAYAHTGKERSMARRVFLAVNEKRESAGKPVLEMNEALNDIAAAHSSNMASHRTPFGHDGFDKRYKSITERWPRISAMAENVAKNSSVEGAVEAWWRSTGHHKNIQGAYTHTGIGIAKGADGYYYFTQIFVKKW